MARETAKERDARMDNERDAALAERKLAYPKLFLSVLAEAVAAGFELNKVDPETGAFTFCNRNTNDMYIVFDSFGPAGMNEWPLERLAIDVREIKEARLESVRKYELCKIAIAKLTTEERELLGIM